MIVYILGFILSFIFLELAFKKKKNNEIYLRDEKNDNLFFYRFCHRASFFLLVMLGLIPLTIISAVRFDVGTDYMFTYYPNFYKILDGQKEYSEIGFLYLNKLIQVFTDNSFWLFFITSIIFNFLMLITIFKYSKNILLSFLVLFLSCIYFTSLNNVRQSISACFLLAGFPYLMDKKYIKYLIFILLASIFHFTAIIGFLLIIFMKIKLFDKRFLLKCFIITLLVPILCFAFIYLIRLTKYNYFLISHFNNGQSNKLNIIYGLFFFLFFYFFSRKKIYSDKTLRVFNLCSFMYFIISMSSMFIKVSEMISRVALYFLFYQILFIPYLVSIQEKKKYKAIIIITYIVLYSMYFIYFIILKGYHQVLPYQTIFMR